MRSKWRVLLMAGILLLPVTAWAQCTNCTTTSVASDVVLTFTSGAGTFTPPAGVTSVQYLVVGGGGGGGGVTNVNAGGTGGGGAGGYRAAAGFAVTPATVYNIAVGAGGAGAVCTTACAAGANGGDSTFSTIIATGGGRGAYIGNNNGAAGGSGGGGRLTAAGIGGAGTAGQGNDGGDGAGAGNSAGGGGGASAAGANGAGGGVGGAGGAGTSNNISGAAVTYAGGGGGGGYGATGGAGGAGGGGSAPAARGAGTDGAANTGGGGGGATGSNATTAHNGGAGGSGIVVIRYSLTQSQTMSPNAAADCTSLGGGGTNWSNTGRASISDNSYATANVDGTTTDPLRCLDYRFTIPLTATVVGIEVFIERRSNSTADGGSRDASLFMVKAGATVGASRATATIYTTADTVEGHGSSSDLWGTTWTPAEINAANFGTVFTARKPNAAGVAHTISVDHIFITVHYIILSPVVTPGGFNAFETSTAASAITGKIYTKLVGAGFNLDVVAISGGAQQAGFTNTVSVQLVANTTGAALGADNCPTTFTTVQTVSPDPTITGGRSTVGFAAVATAYRDVRVRVQYPVSSPTVTGCSTDNFSIRPAAFSSVTSNMTNSGTTGAPVAKAGDAFTLTAIAGAGYNGTPVIDNTKITAHAGAVQIGAIGGTFSAANPVSGTATGALFTYSEVGSFLIGVNGVYDSSFTVMDVPGTDCTNDFSNALVGGRYGCSFGNSSQTAVIGRFTPDHFDVALTAPTFTTGCTAGGFTYVGQTFNYTVQPVITVTAKNSAGLGNATTQNYQGASWWKITSGSLTGKSYTAFAGSLDTTGISGTDPVIRYNGDGAGAGEPAAGQGTLNFNSGTGFFFTRSNPVAPFDADISLAINVIDADGVAASNPVRFGQAAAGLGMAFNNGKQMRFGRLRLNNANGSPLVALPMLMETQYWNGSSFITNADDGCTTVSAANVGLGNYTGNLNSPETAPSVAGGAFSKGRKTLTMSAPGAANNGSVDIVLNLGTTTTIDSCLTWAVTPTPAGASLSHLRGQWCGAAYSKDPTARATFGTYRGSDEVIHIQENFQ